VAFQQIYWLTQNYSSAHSVSYPKHRNWNFGICRASVKKPGDVQNLPFIIDRQRRLPTLLKVLLSFSGCHPWNFAYIRRTHLVTPQNCSTKFTERKHRKAADFHSCGSQSTCFLEYSRRRKCNQCNKTKITYVLHLPICRMHMFTH
jgi:hypothetical protein